MTGWLTRNRGLVALALALTLSMPAHAVPVLQLYVEGATYDNDHESWVFDSSGGGPIRLWAIGNVSGGGGKGTIFDVKLSAVYPDVTPGVKDATISLSPSTTSGFGGFLDPSTPSAPSATTMDACGMVGIMFNDCGDSPVMSNGQTVPSHGTYGAGWEWQEFSLGDFSLTDSQIEDFISSFPTPGGTTEGQINVYEISFDISDPSITDIHFDLYDGIMAGNKFKTVFAPFSHDAGTGTNDPYRVPEPGTLALAALALLALATSKPGLAAPKRRRPR